MLVLSCELGSKVQIGDDIVITVAQIKGDHVKIGIDAPREQNILRMDENGNVLTGGKEGERNERD